MTLLLLKRTVAAFIAFIVLDVLWLGFVVKDFNLQQLSEIGRIHNGAFDLAYPPAILVYILMAISIWVFVLPKVLQDTRLKDVFFTGALMGAIIYGVYDGTNLAILKNYPMTFALVDMAWGTFASGMVTVITKKIVG